MLGIAADDIFVFCDAWRQGGQIPSLANDEKKRMAYAFRRSFRAIAVTSSTTAVAFLANASSDIRPIRSFGIFAAIIIPVNFFIVITIMPSVQIFYDRKLKHRCNYTEYFKCFDCCKKKSHQHIAGDGAQTAPSRITKFFSTTFNSAIYKARYVLVAAFIVLGVVAGIVAANIGPLTSQEEYLPRDDPLILLQNEVEANFITLGSFVAAGNIRGAIFVMLTWGVQGLNRSDVNLWDPSRMGEVVWDDTFTITPEANQQFLLDLCSEMRENRTSLVKDGKVNCWIESMDSFVQETTLGDENLQLPLADEATFQKYFQMFLETEEG